jgi:single-strand DNA-binding protein
VWDRQAELAGEQLKKGSAVYVDGRLTSRSWETPEGQKRQVVEVRADRIQFLDRAEHENPPAGESPTGEATGITELPF